MVRVLFDVVGLFMWLCVHDFDTNRAGTLHSVGVSKESRDRNRSTTEGRQLGAGQAVAVFDIVRIYCRNGTLSRRQCDG